MWIFHTPVFRSDHHLRPAVLFLLGFPSSSTVKNLPATQEPEETRVPVSQLRRLGWELSILAWRIPWTEEPGRLQVHGVAKSWTRLKQLSTAHSTVPLLPFLLAGGEEGLLGHPTSQPLLPGQVSPGIPLNKVLDFPQGHRVRNRMCMAGRGGGGCPVHLRLGRVSTLSDHLLGPGHSHYELATVNVST